MKLMITMLSLFATLINQIQSSRENTIDLYFKAYHSGDIATLEGLMSEDISFKDLTSKVIGQELTLEGKEKTITTLSALFSGVSNLKFKSEFNLISAQFGISAGVISYTNRQSKITYKVVSIVELDRHNKIKRHLEYADYAAALKQLRN